MTWRRPWHGLDSDVMNFSVKTLMAVYEFEGIDRFRDRDAELLPRLRPRSAGGYLRGDHAGAGRPVVRLRRHACAGCRTSRPARCRSLLPLHARASGSADVESATRLGLARGGARLWTNTGGPANARASRSTSSGCEASRRRSWARCVEVRWRSDPMDVGILGELERYKLPALSQAGVRVAHPSIALIGRSGFTAGLLEAADRDRRIILVDPETLARDAG